MKVLVLFLLVAGAFAAVRRIPSSRTDIVGGDVAEPGQFPFQLSVQKRTFSNFHFCGASVYTEKIAISAGHCVQNFNFNNPQFLFVVAGEQSLKKPDLVNEQVRQITKIIRHEYYDHYTLENDISLLFWDTPLKFNARVQPIVLPDPMTEESGDFIVSGWGKTSEGGSPSDELLYVTVPFVDDDTCSEENKQIIASSMICAGEEGKDSCQGDSGGPLSQDGVLVGIVSWGIGCAEALRPGVYTQVSFFVDWIKTNSVVDE